MPKFNGDLDALNTFLLDHSYVDGFVPSSNDAETFSQIKDAPDSKSHPNVRRWWNHINSFSVDERKSWKAAGGGESTEEKKAAGGDEDDFDLFADNGDDDAYEAEIQRRADEAAAKKAAQRAATGKDAPVMRSAVILDVKPWDDSTDLVELEKLVRGIEMEGLEWKASELKPIAFGIKKLSIMCHIVDDLVSTDALEEQIREFEDQVQSVDIGAFTKL